MITRNQLKEFARKNVDIKGLQNIDFCTQKEYERNIGNLLPSATPYSQVVEDIRIKLNDLLD